MDVVDDQSDSESQNGDADSGGVEDGHGLTPSSEQESSSENHIAREDSKD